jgi:hypothetical protein
MKVLDLGVLREFRERYGSLPTVSLYLPIDGRREKPENWAARFRNLIRTGVAAENEGLPREDFKRISDFLRSGVRDPSARGVAVFSSAGARLWETAVLPYAVPERLVFGRGPALRPALENALIYEPVGLVLIQRSSYEIGRVHGGTKAVLASGTIDVPQRVKAGGWQGLRMSRINRKQKQEEARTYKEIVEALEPARKKGKFSRFLLAGPKESLITLKTVMPAKTAEHILGEIHLDTSFSEDLLLNKANEALEAGAEKAEQEAVKRLDAEASQGHNGVVGLEPTLVAVSNGTAESIVASRSLAAAGGVCGSCHWLGTRLKCEHCGGEVRPVPDVVEEAVWRILSSGGRFIPVLNDRTFSERWGTGALLRFRAV